MDRSSRTELGRTMTEMITVLLVISVVIIVSLSGFQNIKDRVIANALQKTIGTHIAQRINEDLGPAAYTAKALTYMGPYKYPFHIESGTASSGAKKDYYWITIGASQGNKAKTLSGSLCQRLLNELNLPVMPAVITVNDVPSLPTAEACQDTPEGNVLTLYFQKKSAQNATSAADFINSYTQP